MKIEHSLKQPSSPQYESLWLSLVAGVWLALYLILSSTRLSYGNAAALDSETGVQGLLQSELAKSYSVDTVEMSGPIHWASKMSPGFTGKVTLLGDDSNGNIHFSLIGPTTRDYSEGWARFAVWVPCRIAIRRIRPGDPLEETQFSTQKINIAAGKAREYRGVLLSADTPLGNLEALQTIIEGQFLTTTSVQRIPDVRRGDAIQIQLKSSDIVLSMPGVAEEPAYLNHRVKVTTLKYKRELLGELHTGGIVEVKI